MSETLPHIDFTDRRAGYRALAQALEGLLAGEHDWLANAANTCALLYAVLPALNWLGFYFLRGGELVVGPFQGKPACVRIALGRGVCGTAAVRGTLVNVPDVNAFAGHIACDAASRSELVVPLVTPEGLRGVLDLDSPQPARFDALDERGMSELATIYLKASRF